MSAPLGKPTPAVLVTPDDLTRSPAARLPDPADAPVPLPASVPAAAPQMPEAEAPAAKPAGKGKPRRKKELTDEELSAEPVRPGPACPPPEVSEGSARADG